MTARRLRHTLSLPAFLVLPALTGPIALPSGNAASAGEPVIAYETPGPVPLLAPTYGQEWAEVISITEHAATPRRVVVGEGQKLAWRSRAGVSLRIVFDAEVARSMRCTEVVNFSLQDDELRSELLRTGEVASLCELAPGRYVYHVEKDPHAASTRALSERVRGEVVVLPRQTARAEVVGGDLR